MWIRWGGIVSNHRNLSIFTFISPIALTVCLPWQRLFSDQLCADLASAPFPSTLPTQVAFLPAASQTGLYQQQRGRERTRKRGGWRGRAKDGRRQRTSGKEKFLSQSEENFWRTEMMHRRRTQFTRLYLVSSATHTHTQKWKQIGNSLHQFMALGSQKTCNRGPWADSEQDQCSCVGRTCFLWEN